jgi:prophage DNA circulation protein
MTAGGQLDWKPKWHFGPIRWITTSARLHLAVRNHVHEYPHTPGGKPEKMGRKLYEITVEGIFESNALDPGYANGLDQLGVFRTLVEDETTEDLVIPWVGTVRAFCEDLEITERNTNRSGLAFTAKFLEDWDFEFPIEQFLKMDVRPLGGALENYKKQKSLLDSVNEVFETINDVANTIFGYRDQFYLYRSLVDSKIQFFEQLCRDADEVRDELKDPKNLLFLESFGDLWSAIRDLATDMDSKGAELKYYTTPMVMSLQEIAVAIYDNANRSLDLLGLNPIEDPYTIPAGTRIRYYDVDIAA